VNNINRLTQFILAVVGTILIPLAISSLSVASNYGTMQEALESVKEDGRTAITQNAIIMENISDIKTTNATQAQQLATLERTQNAILEIQRDKFEGFVKVETQLEAVKEHIRISEGMLFYNNSNGISRIDSQ
jgi:predicted nuclease with TOPRIM domain